MAKVQTPSYPERNSINSILFETGQLPFRINQLLGYLPIPTVFDPSGKKRGFENRSFSWPLVTSITLILTSIATAAGYILQTDIGGSWFPSSGPMAKNTFKLVGIGWSMSLAFAAVIARLAILLNRDQFVEFWNGLVDMTEFIDTSSGSFDYFKSSCKSLEKNLRLICLVYLGCSVYLYGAFGEQIISTGNGSNLGNFLDYLILLVNTFHYFSLPLLHYFMQIFKFNMNIILQGFRKVSLRLGDPFSEKEIRNNGINIKKCGVADSIVFITLRSDSKDRSHLASISVNTLMNCYERLEWQVLAFNRLFGARFVVEVLYLLLQTVFSAYFVIILSSDGLRINSLLQNGIAAGTLGYSLFRICKGSSELTELGDEFVRNLAGIASSQSLDTGTMKKIELLIARLSNNPLTVRNHFFDLNLRLLTSIVGAVTTYLVVLAQFQAGDGA